MNTPTRYYIHLKDQPTYMSVVVTGDSFPTVDELKHCLHRDILTDCLRLAERRIVIHSKKHINQCKGNICKNDPIWIIIAKPYGYDVDYAYDYTIIERSILHHLFHDVMVMAKSGDEMLVGFIVKPSTAIKWFEHFTTDPFGALYNGEHIDFINLKLANLILVARLLNVNITLQIYTIRLITKHGYSSTEYQLFKSIYIKRDGEYVQPDRSHIPRPSRAHPPCGCPS